jgi:hypothetical protein
MYKHFATSTCCWAEKASPPKSRCCTNTTPIWVTNLRSTVLSIVTGGGKWVEITVPMDPLYLSVLVSAERKFWRCAQFGELPHLINAERPRFEAVRMIS